MCLRKEILDEMQSSNIAAAVSGPAQAATNLKSTLAADSAKRLIEKVRAKRAGQKKV